MIIKEIPSYRIKYDKFGNKEIYFPEFKKYSILTSFFLKYIQDENLSIKKTIQEQVEFKLKEVGIDCTKEPFRIFGCLEGINSDSEVFIEKNVLIELKYRIKSEITKIKLFGEIVIELDNCFDTFICYNDAKDYYNKIGVCGIVNDNKKWIFCGQKPYKSNSNPLTTMYSNTYDSLNDLMAEEIINFKKENKIDKH